MVGNHRDDFFKDPENVETYVQCLIDDETGFEVAARHMKEGKTCDWQEIFVLDRVMETV